MPSIENQQTSEFTHVKKILLEQILYCPRCRGSLEFQEHKSLCANCSNEYPIRDGKYYFIPVESSEQLPQDPLDRWKSKLKKHDGFYQWAVRVISPVYFRQGVIDRFLGQSPVEVNLGSGNTCLHRDAINVDTVPYQHVDVVADITCLPFKTQSVDRMINVAVLEHVAEPARAVDEVYRILKTRGEVLSIVPFLQPFHASPYDYQRYTLEGLSYLHKAFKPVERGVFSGPASCLLWCFLESVASILSLGIRRLHHIWFLLFMLVTFPFKFLDILWVHSPTASIVASCLYYQGLKESDES